MPGQKSFPLVQEQDPTSLNTPGDASATDPSQVKEYIGKDTTPRSGVAAQVSSIELVDGLPIQRDQLRYEPYQKADSTPEPEGNLPADPKLLDIINVTAKKLYESDREILDYIQNLKCRTAAILEHVNRIHSQLRASIGAIERLKQFVHNWQKMNDHWSRAELLGDGDFGAKLEDDKMPILSSDEPSDKENDAGNRGRFPAMVRGQTGAFPTVKERLCKNVDHPDFSHDCARIVMGELAPELPNKEDGTGLDRAEVEVEKPPCNLLGGDSWAAPVANKLSDDPKVGGSLLGILTATPSADEPLPSLKITPVDGPSGGPAPSFFGPNLDVRPFFYGTSGTPGADKSLTSLKVTPGGGLFGGPKVGDSPFGIPKVRGSLFGHPKATPSVDEGLGSLKIAPGDGPFDGSRTKPTILIPTDDVCWSFYEPDGIRRAKKPFGSLKVTPGGGLSGGPKVGDSPFGAPKAGDGLFGHPKATPSVDEPLSSLKTTPGDGESGGPAPSFFGPNLDVRPFFYGSSGTPGVDKSLTSLKVTPGGGLSGRPKVGDSPSGAPKDGDGLFGHSKATCGVGGLPSGSGVIPSVNGVSYPNVTLGVDRHLPPLADPSPHPPAQSHTSSSPGTPSGLKRKCDSTPEDGEDEERAWAKRRRVFTRTPSPNFKMLLEEAGYVSDHILKDPPEPSLQSLHRQTSISTSPDSEIERSEVIEMLSREIEQGASEEEEPTENILAGLKTPPDSQVSVGVSSNTDEIQDELSPKFPQKDTAILDSGCESPTNISAKSARFDIDEETEKKTKKVYRKTPVKPRTSLRVMEEEEALAAEFEADRLKPLRLPKKKRIVGARARKPNVTPSIKTEVDDASPFVFASEPPLNPRRGRSASVQPKVPASQKAPIRKSARDRK